MVVAFFNQIKNKQILKIRKMNTIRKTNRTILGLLVVVFMMASCSKDDNTKQFIEPLTIQIPDTNFEQELMELGYDTNGLNGNILQEDAEAVIILDVSNRSISSLQGIEGFLNLKTLYCNNNDLTNIDVSRNTKLVQLDCQFNLLTSLDLSHNLELTGLYAFVNQITSLDLSNDINLISLDCNENQLTSLNVKNNNNSNFIDFKARSNANLYCIQVDDAIYSNVNWSSGIDNLSAFGEDCN